ncbi:MAG: hypothetical protein AAB263_13565, partial [Planctomycetota bacterium]
MIDSRLRSAIAIVVGSVNRADQVAIQVIATREGGEVRAVLNLVEFRDASVGRQALELAGQPAARRGEVQIALVEDVRDYIARLSS